MADAPLPRYPRTIRRSARTRVELPVQHQQRKRPVLGINALPLILLAGFAIAILIGTILLMLPVSSEDRTWTSPVTALFVSTSAVCVTGLTPVDTSAYWSGFGEGVILALIQLGGLGIMTSTTLVFLLLGWRVGIRERLFLSSALDLNRTGGVIRFTRRAVVFALSFEAVGAVILTARFALDESPARAAWLGVFHSVSAFNNAGFDLFGGFQSLTGHRDPLTLVTISVLALAGGLGYMVMEDLRQARRNRLSLDTKLVLRTTAGLVAIAFVVITVFEWNRTLAHLTLPDKLLQGWFAAMTPRTAGFTALPMDQMAEESHFVTMGLMFIGGGSGSTAGGIKVGTLAILIAAVISTIRGRQHIEAAGREIQRVDADRAFTVVSLAAVAVFLLTIVLSLLEPYEFMPLMYEATSALGTAGLSDGMTPNLSTPTLLLLTLAMYVGRLGPLTLVLALLKGTRPERLRLPEEHVRIG